MEKDYSDWKKITYFKCPCCTSAQVIIAPDDDYYMGYQYICLGCFCSFYIPASSDLPQCEIDAVKKHWTEDADAG